MKDEELKETLVELTDKELNEVTGGATIIECKKYNTAGNCNNPMTKCRWEAAYGCVPSPDRFPK